MIIYCLSTTDSIRGMLEVGTSAEFPVVDALEWAFECGLPIELTVGLTMSLTGNYSDESIWDEWDEQLHDERLGPTFCELESTVFDPQLFRDI